MSARLAAPGRHGVSVRSVFHFVWLLEVGYPIARTTRRRRTAPDRRMNPLLRTCLRSCAIETRLVPARHGDKSARELTPAPKFPDTLCVPEICPADRVARAYTQAHLWRAASSVQYARRSPCHGCDGRGTRRGNSGLFCPSPCFASRHPPAVKFSLGPNACSRPR